MPAEVKAQHPMKPRLTLTTIGLLLGLGIVAGVATFTYRHFSRLSDRALGLTHPRSRGDSAGDDDRGGRRDRGAARLRLDP